MWQNWGIPSWLTQVLISQYLFFYGDIPWDIEFEFDTQLKFDT